MATVQIFLKSGQVIILQDTKAIKTPGATEGIYFETPRGTQIVTLEQDQIVAVISEDEWS